MAALIHWGNSSFCASRLPAWRGALRSDQLEFLVDNFAHCDSYGCSECGRYFAVRKKLMKPFVEVEYHRFAIAEQRRRSLDSGEQAFSVVAIGKKVQDISSRTQ